MTNSSAKSPRPKAKKLAEKAASPKFSCDYCHTSFSFENTLLVHVCEPKRRFVAQDDKYVKLGFYTYQRFHEINYVGRKEKTYAEFAASNLYLAFTKFGRYLLNLNAIEPKQFVNWLIKAEVKLDHWERPVVYETYIRWLNTKESPGAAIERAFTLMQSWALENDDVWTDFFRKISTPLATLWLKAGRISPWVLFLSESGPEMLMDRMTEEQRQIIYSNIDPAFWDAKFKVAVEESDMIREELHAAGI